MVRLPIIIVNFKAYERGTGPAAVKLAKLCEAAAKATRVQIAIAVQPADISAVAKAVKIPIFAQHIDPIQYGTFTGSILAESVKSAGASGTLLNHAERRLANPDIRECIHRARKAGLLTVVCAENSHRAAEIVQYKPGMIALEDPELISGKVSISSADPEMIRSAVRKVHAIADIPLLCGAGVHSALDVKSAMALGTRGILIANAVVNAPDAKRVLIQLAKAMK